jgi:hypothetical protein
MLEDASLTYPVSALFTRFLIKELGIEKYIEIYKKFSGDDFFVETIDLNSIFKNFENKFNEFVKDTSNESDIIFIEDNYSKIILHNDLITIRETKDYYSFETNSGVLLIGSYFHEGYKSRKFHELFLDAKYSSEKYLIIISPKEVNVYNLFTNNLIASYSSGFSQTGKTIPYENGFYKFSINKNIFDEDLTSLQISTINSK